MKEDEMSEGCSTYEKDEDRLGGLDVDGRIALK
jgi:hypothetical protein